MQRFATLPLRRGPDAVRLCVGERHQSGVSGSVDVVTRLVCLLCAVAIVSAGLREQSLALVVLASGIVMVALMGVGDDQPFWRDIAFPSIEHRGVRCESVTVSKFERTL